MTVREYIGARYVPIFGRKDETSIEWDVSKPYEPLTIVLYQGNSYTSRQYVPAGIPITNGEFWALTGNYNAQIEQYRSEVAEVADDMGELSGTVSGLSTQLGSLESIIPASEFSSSNTVKDYIDGVRDADKTIAVYIGNSFALGTGSTDGNTGVFALTKDLFDEAYLYYGSGIGFDEYSGHTGNQDFYYRTNQAAGASAFANEDVTHVIYVSAMGDTRAVCENSNFVQLKSTIELAKTNFPNARIYIYYAEITANKNVQSSYSTLYPLAQIRVHTVFDYYQQIYGYTYLGWGGWNINFSNSYTSSDYYHPNDRGYAALAHFFKDSFNSAPRYPIKAQRLQTSGKADAYLTMNSPTTGTLTLYRSNGTQLGQADGWTAGQAIQRLRLTGTTGTTPIGIPSNLVGDIAIQASTANRVFGSFTVENDAATGNVNLMFTPRATLASGDIATGALYGSNITLPINMFMQSDLRVF